MDIGERFFTQEELESFSFKSLGKNVLIKRNVGMFFIENYLFFSCQIFPKSFDEVKSSESINIHFKPEIIFINNIIAKRIVFHFFNI